METLIELLKKIDGIGKKSAEKILVDLISNKESLISIDNVIKSIETDYVECERCYYFKYKNRCAFCDDSSRNKNILCVVSSVLDAQRILHSDFRGVIHVLKGEINVNKNRFPENLTLKELFVRINPEVEVLLALNLTFNGEVTSNYIANAIKSKANKVSRIARGIPLGGMLDYIDNETLNDAIKNRKKV
ncbi:toprim domain-containing protein [Spiroplasma apis]|uniref:Recombination protein RecR n=1 Tax=Spiroplasma apis B31 TaxID=1276258 RepID=V5RIB5_SPIAP|nr:toprim domain-containing protein [Spiroplasma apis]AHB35856.1 recombination protein RecR [Spiroplasma apis B31]